MDGRIIRRPADGALGVVVSALHHDILQRKTSATAWPLVRMVLEEHITEPSLAEYLEA